MLKKTIVFLLIVSVIACKREKPVEVPQATAHTILLKWNKGYTNETAWQAETGLLWALSFLGAEWPLNSYAQAIQWKDSTHLQLDLGYAGFENKALLAWDDLLNELKKSEEYDKRGGIDMGRFIMLSLNAGNHYYKITGMAKTYDEYKAPFVFDSMQAAIIESVVSNAERIVDLPPNALPLENAYTTHEGIGSIAAHTFQEKEREVMDVMKNGQLRFGIYNMEGDLIIGADTAYSTAGKPAKCFWCHEINIQRAFNASTSIPGYYAIDSFQAIVQRNQQKLEQYRTTLSSKTDFSRKQDHTLMELLYISFSEPSAERLSLEWGISLAQVEQRLQGLNTHIHNEFPFLGNLYWRYEIENRAPFTAISAPHSAREYSGYEPNLIH